MKAIIQRKYGAPADVLELQDIEKPRPRTGEVLVRIHATTVAGDDWHLMRGLPYFARLGTGMRKPNNVIPGQDLAGVVEAVGEGVTSFVPGDEVFGWNGGTFAEYVAVPEGNLEPMPADLTFEQAASVPIVAFTALQGLRDKGQIRAGQEVLIVGASGGVGTFAVQLAKAFGATVTGVASSRNVELVRELGADRVVDYTREDYTAEADRYDLILDMVGNRSLKQLRHALKSDGTLVMIGSSRFSADGNQPRGLDRLFMGSLDRWLKAGLTSLFSGQKLRPLIHKDSHEDLAILRGMLETGQIRPVVDRSYSIEQLTEALRYQDERRAPGKVVITL